MDAAHLQRRALKRRGTKASTVWDTFEALGKAQFNRTQESNVKAKMKVRIVKCARLAERVVLVGKTPFSFNKEGICVFEYDPGRPSMVPDFETMLRTTNGVQEIVLVDPEEVPVVPPTLPVGEPMEEPMELATPIPPPPPPVMRRKPKEAAAPLAKLTIPTPEEMDSAWNAATNTVVDPSPPAGLVEASEESSEAFEVVIMEAGHRLIELVRVVRETCGFTLQEAKAVVERLPYSVKRFQSRDAAEALKMQLEECGATVELRSGEESVEFPIPSESDDSPRRGRRRGKK